VGLACGGTIRVLVEPLGAALPADLWKSWPRPAAARRPAAYVVNLDTWERRLAGPEDFPDRFRMDRSGLEEDGRDLRRHPQPAAADDRRGRRPHRARRSCPWRGSRATT
jgi:xanthine/CO dehydrogenase XdhC/CoxF family maturation factor